jgi:3-oxoadipate enol-lactonase
MSFAAAASCATARGPIAYELAGDGPVLVVLHPIGVDRTWWRDYVTAWAPTRKVVAIDMLGHGASARLTAPITLAEHARHIWGLLDAEGISAASFFGVSMGGMVAQYAAIERPKSTRALVVCATAATFPDEARAAVRSRGDMSVAADMATVVTGTLQRWFSADAPADLVARCKATLLQDDWYSWSANWDAISRLETLDGLAAIDVPTLAISCSADASMPPAMTRCIADAARGEFVSVEGAPHFGAFESPRPFAAAVDSFLHTREGGGLTP